jgi:hypothetical protein
MAVRVVALDDSEAKTSVLAPSAAGPLADSVTPPVITEPVGTVATDTVATSPTARLAGLTITL